MSGRSILYSAIALLAVISACSPATVAPTEPAPTEAPATVAVTDQVRASHQIVFMFNNTGNHAALLLVAEDSVPIGRQVGTATPATLPDHERALVVFTVPDAENWAIFVNPGADTSPLFTASDLVNCRGRVSINVTVGENGQVSWRTGNQGRDPSCVTQ